MSLRKLCTLGVEDNMTSKSISGDSMFRRGTSADLQDREEEPLVTLELVEKKSNASDKDGILEKGASIIKARVKSNCRGRGRSRVAAILLSLIILVPVITWIVCYFIFGTICKLQTSGIVRTLPCSIFDHWKTLRRSDIQDFKVDVGMMDDLPSLALHKYYTLGKHKLKESSVLMIGLVSNAEGSLYTLKSDINELMRKMPKSKLVICESCSKDGTRKILKKWKHYTRHELEIPTGWGNTAQNCSQFVDNDPDNGIWGVRESHLAEIRNECIAAALGDDKGQSYDYVVTIDMDVFRIDVSGVLDSFGTIGVLEKQAQPWGVLCANGKFVNGIYRDVYAHRIRSIDTAEHYLGYNKFGQLSWFRDKFMNLPNREKIIRKVNSIVHSSRRHKLFAVDSCFGGLAIYNFDAFHNCTYHGVAWDKKSRSLRPDCEHISFNACASGQYKISRESNKYSIEFLDGECQHCKPALLNPRMQVWHGKNAWTGMLGPELYYPIMFLGLWMAVLDMPLKMLSYSDESVFLVSWLKIYIIIGTTLLVLHIARYVLKAAFSRAKSIT